jgi:uncharacterized membrane protein YhaH (DUF805 family)
MENPYEAPQAVVESTQTLRERRDHYGGIGRLAYVALMIGAVGGSNIFSDMSRNAGGIVTNLLITITFWVLLFVAAFFRLKNIGMNPWWCLLLFVPLANLAVFFRCLAYPEGYADTKELDVAGKVVVGFCIAFILLGAITILTQYMAI